MMNKRHLFLSIFASTLLLITMWHLLSAQQPALAAAPPVEDQGVPHRVAITKTVVVAGADSEPGAYAPNQRLQFAITLTNISTASIPSISVFDDYDQNVITVNESDIAPRENLSIGEDGRLEWRDITLPEGGIWTARYTAIVQGAERFATLSDQDRPARADNVVSALIDGEVDASFAIPKVVASPLISKTVVGNTVIGEDGATTMRILVRNDSPVPLNNVEIADSFSPSATVRIAGVDISDQTPSIASSFCEVPQGNSSIRWCIDQLGPDREWFATYEVVFDGNSMNEVRNQTDPALTNRVNLTTDENRQSIAATLASPIVLKVEANPRLELNYGFRNTKDKATFEPGDTILYTATVRNIGTAAATDLTIRSEFDEAVVSELAENGQIDEGTAAQQIAANFAEWRLGELAANGSASFTHTLKIKSDLEATEAKIASLATVQAANHPTLESAPLNISVSISVLEIGALDLRDINEGELRPGDIVEVIVGVVNTGLAPSEGQTSSLQSSHNDIAELEDGSLKPEDGTVNPEDGIIEWNIPALQPNETSNFSYRLVVSESPAEGANTLDVTASILKGDIPGDSGSRSAPVVPIEPTATPTPTTTAAVDSPSFGYIAGLMALLFLGALYLVFSQSRNLAVQDSDARSRDVVEMFTILIIVGAILLLAMIGDITPQIVIPVLSGIAGYMLGRGSGKAGS
ncbi:MAG: hypothetical protein JSW55_05090 [Chloroflexota bacterium]|nr:MAG: hypothetical protein JSW55_05090 [Chloroflexota bacterium]